VLADFQSHEDPEALVGRAADAVGTLLGGGVERAQLEINRR
jgi:hypothetical protein